MFYTCYIFHQKQSLKPTRKVVPVTILISRMAAARACKRTTKRTPRTTVSFRKCLINMQEA